MDKRSNYVQKSSHCHTSLKSNERLFVCKGTNFYALFRRYKEASLKFYTILLSFADELQAVSVDEALLDVSRAVANLKSEMMQKDPHVSRDCSKMLAEQIRERLLAVTGCQGEHSYCHFDLPFNRFQLA